MKLFSNFDTGMGKRLFQEARAEHGNENALFVRRYFIYLGLRVLLPSITRLFLVAGLLYFAYILLPAQGGFSSFIRRLVRATIIISSIYLILRIIKSLIDYYMDFTIITPREIACYNQRGLFTTTTRTLDITKIKSVVVLQRGIFKSILNYGSIVFFSEGDQSGEMGDITLHYITDPNKLREKINDIVVRPLPPDLD